MASSSTMSTAHRATCGIAAARGATLIALAVGSVFASVWSFAEGVPSVPPSLQPAANSIIANNANTRVCRVSRQTFIMSLVLPVQCCARQRPHYAALSYAHLVQDKLGLVTNCLLVTTVPICDRNCTDIVDFLQARSLQPRDRQQKG